MAVLGRWQLHPQHLYIIRSYLGLEDLTLPLEGRGFGATTEQLGQIAQRETPTMEQLGILVDDEVQPQLKQALELLTKPYLWVDSVWFPEVGGNAAWRAVAAFTENDQVILGLQAPSEEGDHYGGALTVEIHQKMPLPQVILPTLPPAPPGNQGMARVPASSMKTAEHAEDEEQGSLLQGGPAKGSSGDRILATYYAIGNAEHARIGQIAANMRDLNGTVKRSKILHWFDNIQPDGRYINEAERGNTGETMFVIAPADARLIHYKIEKLIKSVR